MKFSETLTRGEQAVADNPKNPTADGPTGAKGAGEIPADPSIENDLNLARARVEFFFNALEHSSQPFASRTTDGRLLMVNRAFAKLTGYTDEELRSATGLKRLTPPEWIDRENRILEKLKETGEPQVLEKEYIRKDGSRVPVELRIHLATSAEGETVYYAFVTDISKRRTVQQELAGMRSRELAYLENLPVGVWFVGPTGEIEYGNEAGRRIWAGERKVPINRYAEYKGWRHATGEPVKAEEWAATRAFQKGETTLNEEIDIECFDGTRKTILNSAVPVRDEVGQIIGAVIFNQDISERKGLELDQAFLFGISETIREAASAEALMEKVVGSVGRHLDVSRCIFIEIDNRDETALIHRDFHREGQPSIAGRIPLAQFSPGSIDILKNGQVLVNDDIKNNPRTARYYEAGYKALGMEAFVGVPLMRESKWVAGLAVVQDAARHWTAAELNLLESVAERVWLAVERLRSEASSRASEERFRLALSSGAVTVYEQDAELRYLWVYPATPYSPDVVGKTDTELDPSPEAEYRESLKRMVLESGEPMRREVTATVFGRRHYYDLLIEPRFDDVGTVVGVGGTALEITERKRAEEALRSSEEKFSRAFQASPDGVVISRVNDGLIHEANESFLAMIGLPREEVIGRRPSELEIYPDPEMREQSAEVIRAEGRLRDRESVIRKRTGETIHTLCSAEMIDIDGQPHALSIIRDVTEQKKAAAEKQRLLTEAQAANRAKDEFLAVLSHELRTPLNSMKGWLSLLRDGMLDEAEAPRALEVVARGVETQQALIEDILDISRIISGKLALARERVTFVSVVSACVEAARPAAEAKGLELKAHYDTADEVEGDPFRLQQVVNNILSNAIKFTPDGGRIEVELERRDGRLALMITDTGVGISPEFLPRIFDRFHQADSSSRRKHGGLGLGLSIARYLVELHGGSIAAYSPGEGRGSTFVLDLPSAEAHIEATIRRPHAADDDGTGYDLLEGVKLLIVEDDFDSAEMLRVLLTKYGAEVTCMASAPEGLTTLSESKFDLLISDLGLAEMDGYDLIKAVRSELKIAPETLPAIALSGYASLTDRERSLEQGFQLHLAKPVDVDTLPTTIISLVRQNA